MNGVKAVVKCLVSEEPFPRSPDYETKITINDDTWVPDLYTFFMFLQENPDIARQFVSWLTGEYPTNVKFEMEKKEG